ncbi:MAG: SDR family NAD(P)-dependent oxidoreductase [Candidatus Helarchaeota archaeon]
MSLDGKVAIVTGGGRGIGKAIALDFARNGANVVVAARTVAEIEEVASQIRALGRESYAIRTDMTKEDDIKTLVKQTYEKFGRIDILVNNAGVSTGVEIKDMKTETWDLILNVNLRGVFLTTRETLKIMEKQRSGHIINISSGFGIEGQPYFSAYGASKAGVLLFSDVLAKENRFIKVYVINPGLIDTKMAEAAPGAKTPPEVIAPIATFLASDMNKLPSGTVVKRLQLDALKEAISPLIQGRTFPNQSAFLKEIEPKLNPKILRNIKKYRKMLPFLFKEYFTGQ